MKNLLDNENITYKPPKFSDLKIVAITNAAKPLKIKTKIQS